MSHPGNFVATAGKNSAPISSGQKLIISMGKVVDMVGCRKQTYYLQTFVNRLARKAR